MYLFLWGLRKQVRNRRNLWNSGDGLSFGGGQHLGCSLKVGWWFRLFTWDGLNEPGIDLIWSDGLRKHGQIKGLPPWNVFPPIYPSNPGSYRKESKNHSFCWYPQFIPDHFLDNPKIFRFWWFNSFFAGWIPIITFPSTGQVQIKSPGADKLLGANELIKSWNLRFDRSSWLNLVPDSWLTMDLLDPVCCTLTFCWNLQFINLWVCLKMGYTF
jgi:hypothetical protein